MNRKFLKILFVVPVLIAVTFPAVASADDTQQFEEVFQQGNELYKQGEFRSAINKYNQIADEGYGSGSLYFNMANAYFKDGKLGMAILNYKKALRLMPRDADLRANYRFAKANIKGKEFPEKGIWAWTPLKIYLQSATINEITLISAILYFATLVCVLLIAFRPEFRGYLITTGIVLVIIVFVNSAVLVHQVNVYRKEAVVIKPDLEAKFGPFESATKFFTLQEGMPVVVLRTKDGWDKVRRSDGKTGWVPSGDVKKI